MVVKAQNDFLACHSQQLDCTLRWLAALGDVQLYSVMQSIQAIWWLEHTFLSL